jgi:glycosyltransferase involved in cell wall biosynthesis
MKLLVVMTHYPFPLNTGGAIVAYNVIKRLSLKYSIDLICLQPKDLDVASLDFVDRIEWVPRKQTSKLKEWLCYLKCMLLGLPYSVGSFASVEMERRVNDMITREDIDALLLFDISAIQFCPSSSFYKILINIEDPQSLKLNRMIKLPVLSIGEKIRLLIMSKFMASYENKYLYKMARVFLLSAEDVIDAKEKGLCGTISHFPYGVDHRDSKDIISYESRDRAIVFSGNMFHPPNVDGILFFLRDVFPMVIREVPFAVLWIVGADPDNRIYKAAAKFGLNVVITGRVADVSKYIKQATVSICPVRLKIGVQTKVLEALSWGTPVVTTSSGNSGIGGLTGFHLWVEEDPSFFAKKVCELLKGKNWENISQKGRELVSERFSWERGTEQLEQCINELKAANL